MKLFVLCKGIKIPQTNSDADKNYLQLRFWEVTFQGGSAESPSILLSKRFMHSQLLGDQNYHHRTAIGPIIAGIIMTITIIKILLVNCFEHFICCFWCVMKTCVRKFPNKPTRAMGLVELIS